MDIKCDRCKEWIGEPGALLFGPPRQVKEGDWDRCRKIHLCVECYHLIVSTHLPLSNEPGQYEVPLEGTGKPPDIIIHNIRDEHGNFPPGTIC